MKTNSPYATRAPRTLGGKSTFLLVPARLALSVLTVCACKPDGATAAQSSSAAAPNLPTKHEVRFTSSGQTHVSYVCDSGTPEPTWHGVLISQWIQTKTPLNPTQLALRDLLTLKQVSPPDDWGEVRFELPINYDAVKTNWVSLDIGWFSKDGNFLTCDLERFDRTTNGHCNLSWNINHYSPGQHLLRARLIWGAVDSAEVVGPPLPFYSSNVCTFVEGATLFGPTDVSLQAYLRDPVASYRIELETEEGDHIKTLSGSTTNGMIDVAWNLVDDRGRKYTGASFNGVFHVKYPGDKAPGAPAKVTFSRIGN